MNRRQSMQRAAAGVAATAATAIAPEALASTSGQELLLGILATGCGKKGAPPKCDPKLYADELARSTSRPATVNRDDLLAAIKLGLQEIERAYFVKFNVQVLPRN